MTNATPHKLDIQLISRAAAGDLSRIMKLLAQGANPLAQNSRALREAAEHGHFECASLLIPLSDPRAPNSYGLQLASMNGHIACVEMLIPLSDPRSDDSLALYWAAKNGHLECMSRLIPVSNPSHALLIAARDGPEACLRLLLPLRDSDALLGQALGLAADNGHVDCVIAIGEAAPDSVCSWDVSALAKRAEANGHLDLGTYFRSIAEQRHLLDSVPALAAMAMAAARSARI